MFLHRLHRLHRYFLVLRHLRLLLLFFFFAAFAAFAAAFAFFAAALFFFCFLLKPSFTLNTFDINIALNKTIKNKMTTLRIIYNTPIKLNII